VTSIFNHYEIRARLIPTLVIVSPAAVIPLAFGLSPASDWTASTVVGVAAIAVLYLASLFVRFLGREAEPGMWKAWGGPPSTLMLRAEDTTFPAPTKARIAAGVKSEFNIDLTGVEGKSAAWAEQAGEAFRLARQRIRQADPHGLWSTHNAEYGALRNFYGAAYLMAVVGSIAAVLCAVAWYREGKVLQAALLGISVLLTMIPPVARQWWLPSVLRAAAFRYAESAWSSFLGIAVPGNGDGAKP